MKSPISSPFYHVLLASALAFSACVDQEAVNNVSSLAVEFGAIESGSSEEAAILAFLNRGDLSLRELDIEAGLDKRAALNIFHFRAGPDGAIGTGDDRSITSIAQLDGIPYVGPSAVEQLLRHVIASGGLGGPSTRSREEAILGVVNHPDISFEVLDYGVGLDRRAAFSIFSYRAGPDEESNTFDDARFVTVDEIDELSFVGQSALNKLFSYSRKMEFGEALPGEYAAARAFLAAQGFSEMALSFPAEEVSTQADPGSSVSFERALSLALTSILTDNSDIESPLALVSDYAFEEGQEPAEALRSFMNQPKTFLGLVGLHADGEDGVYPPENGESIQENWVFHFTMGAFSDHLYWVVVPRNGGAVFNYGFN